MELRSGYHKALIKQEETTKSQTQSTQSRSKAAELCILIITIIVVFMILIFINIHTTRSTGNIISYFHKCHTLKVIIIFFIIRLKVVLSSQNEAASENAEELT